MALGKIKVENIMKDDNQQYCAFIYHYLCVPTNSYYCGATIDEANRKSVFKNVKYSYGGLKIDAARKQYQDWNNDWVYESRVITAPTPDLLLDLMDREERGSIIYYDSYENGYNSNRGGIGRGSRSRIMIVAADGTSQIFNSCEDAAERYKLSPGIVYYYAYSSHAHLDKKMDLLFIPIDDASITVSYPPHFITTTTLIP